MCHLGLCYRVGLMCHLGLGYRVRAHVAPYLSWYSLSPYPNIPNKVPQVAHADQAGPTSNSLSKRNGFVIDEANEVCVNISVI